MAVPVAAVPARVEVVDVVDLVVHDRAVVDAHPVPGVHPVRHHVLIRHAEVMRHRGRARGAVAPDASRPVVHARIPPRIAQRGPVVERGTGVCGPAEDTGPGSSEAADRAAVEPAIHRRRHVRRHHVRRRHRRAGEVRAGGVEPAAVKAAAVEAAAVEPAAEAAVGVGAAVARQGHTGRERRRDESLVHDSSSIACSGRVRWRFTSPAAGAGAAP